MQWFNLFTTQIFLLEKQLYKFAIKNSRGQRPNNKPLHKHQEQIEGPQMSSLYNHLLSKFHKAPMEIKSTNFETYSQKFQGLIAKISIEDRVGLKKVRLANFQSLMEQYSEVQARVTLKKCIDKAIEGAPKKYWKADETQYLLYVVDKYSIANNESADHFQALDWQKIAECVPARDNQDCLFRMLSFHSNRISSKPWSHSQCQLFERILQEQKNTSNIEWSEVSRKLYYLNPQKTYRSPRQCKQRYHSFHKPNLKKSPWEDEEDYTLILLYLKYGKKWQSFVKYIDGRNENAIKNRFALLFQAKKDKKLAPSQLLRAVMRKRQKLEKKRQFCCDMVQFSEQNIIQTTVRADSTGNFDSFREEKLEIVKCQQKQQSYEVNPHHHQSSQVFLPSKESDEPIQQKPSQQNELSPTSRYIR